MSENLPALQPNEVSDFGSFRNPEVSLREAELVAQAFRKRAIALELFKTIGASRHLLVEGWQMLGSMYRVTTSIESTRYLDFGNVTGWEATAKAIYVPTGQEISRADAMCLSDEENWGPRNKYEWVYEDGKKVKKLIGSTPTPTQQLRSMAQTRASSKCYANLLKFVARMAGFASTPAEEMTGHEDTSGSMPPQQGSAGPQRSSSSGPVISEPQAKRLYAIGKTAGKSADEAKAILERFGFASGANVTKDKYEEVCKAMESKAPPGAGSAPPNQPPADLRDYTEWPDGIEDEWVRFKGQIYRFDHAKSMYQIWGEK
jgi:hypothetical protein